ncbi:MAG TPA: dUTP diphosphatase [Bacteroidales bacterium]|jgi:dUTP pyrophosphatase|nr:dUTP diphosphatase [Bacteroidales bacterium]HOX74165.1 dUTP diphosphatase [Bacteroidales bacterium]HPM88064.1 dUTP diphosphatase [Bacteroidales bacterium]HQM67883.1 dUTP diphosphatase [Bacteroidales bacterium]
MKIRIVNKSGHDLPEYSTIASAGMDVRANLEKDVIISPGKRALIPTGLYLEIPVGYEAQIRPRSGLAINKGISILNSPGTIDSDYRGEVCIIMINLSEEDFVIRDGDRICQMVISKHERAEWIKVDVLEETERGSGGFGHTGKK